MTDTFVCYSCKEEKPLSEYHKHANRPRGHVSECKSCKSIYRKKYFKENYDKENSRARIKAWRGVGLSITMDEYQAACAKRNNACDICSRTDVTLNVDHNHTTGKIRGFLCGHCNRGLGLLQDNYKVVAQAAQYLKEND